MEAVDAGNLAIEIGEKCGTNYLAPNNPKTKTSKSQNVGVNGSKSLPQGHFHTSSKDPSIFNHPRSQFGIPALSSKHILSEMTIVILS